LPAASHHHELEAAPIIMIGPEAVRLDGRQVAWTKQIAANEKIVELYDQLITLKHNFALLHPDSPFPGEVLVEASRDLPYRPIHAAIDTAERAGYPMAHLAVEIAAEPR
jgi:hypothetical protein